MSRTRFATPREALEAWYAQRDTPESVIESERRDERLRAEGWSEEAIALRLDDGEKKPTLLGGLIDSYYGGSLTPSRVPYVGESSISSLRRSEPRVRFPSWRDGYSE